MKENKITFSIVTVSYNSENTIDKTLNSVRKQLYDNYECIIIDGLSKDRTENVVNNYLDDEKFVFISEVDSGIYDAMNKGIKLAQGEFLIFLNSGDFFFDNMVLSKISNHLNHDIIIGNSCYNYTNHVKFREPDNLSNLWKGMTYNHQCAFYRLKILKCFTFDLNYPVSSVYDQTLRLFYSGIKFHKTDIVISNYDPYGISSKYNLWVIDYLKISIRYFPKKTILILIRALLRYFK